MVLLLNQTLEVFLQLSLQTTGSLYTNAWKTIMLSVSQNSFSSSSLFMVVRFTQAKSLYSGHTEVTAWLCKTLLKQCDCQSRRWGEYVGYILDVEKTYVTNCSIFHIISLSFAAGHIGKWETGLKAWELND